MRAEIIGIGTEILLGDIVNTNAQYLSKELASLGIDVYNQSVVGDNEKRLLETLENGFLKSDIIITTGGLGPTADDITKEVAAKFFNKELIFDKDSFDWIKFYLNTEEEFTLEINKKQAYIPKDSIKLHNNFGTAPGVIINENKKILIILPGPPREMKAMFNEYVVDYLKGLTEDVLKSKVLRLFGISESVMAKKVEYLMNNNSNPTIAPYAKESDTILRITAKASSEEECTEIIKPIEKEIKNILGEYIYGEDEDSLESVVSKLMINKKLSIGVAESCTGGMISSTLISYPGISEVFNEGVVTYSNEAKIRRLGVKEETLDKFGAVSFEVAKEMCEGIAKTSKSNIGVSTTGIAGPSGGTEEKPVGLVYIGVTINNKTIVEKHIFRGNRERIRKRATLTAINLLRKEILKV